MLFLRANLDDLRVTTGTTGSDIEIRISAIIADTASPPAIKAIPSIPIIASITTNVTNQPVLDSSAIAGIASGDTINVQEISAFNNHATVATTVEFNVTDGTNTAVKAKVNLLAGEKLELNENGNWKHFDSNGGEYPAIGNKASQAEMEAGTADDRFVTPLSFNWHPGAVKCWGKANGAGTTLHVNWNVTSITDTGTGRLGVNIGTDFSSANYAPVPSLERSVTALTATGVEDHAIRNASMTAGVFEIESYDQTAILFAAQDPASYMWQVCGDQ